ncbi:phosphate/phosphite/phosphonate ABC transporter substrate-binding protein [uncultured Chloroflexus sp.]|uniref:phosphate/phosphite/phosphonate ABC transporter substrate-binding protein n=1 Tax=uncultured Chloroflexus sp. TaxID=214040 RepID=UPI00260FE4DA|nr:phosphate/phosphite/phosphonate ABC transporter substrate-binding protein [uncultured Chloroflexus sp.]
MRSLKLLFITTIAALVLVACGASGNTGGNTTSNTNTPVTIVWLPNESGAELKDAREAIGAVISETLGRPVEHRTTTDYLIAVEAIANNTAHLGFFGAEAYVQAHDKNPKVIPLVIPSGTDGRLETAVYYSWLAVARGQEGNYQENGVYKIDNIQGKRFAFVSSSSASGFRVPAATIVKYFSQKEKWKNLTPDDLIEGGQNKFFSDVQFGGSHQGAAVALLSGAVEVASFCDVCVQNYVELVSGVENQPGAVYRVLNNASEPFDKFPGAEFVIIASVPVISAPFVANSSLLTADEIKRLQDKLTSDEVTNNPRIFATKAEIDAGFRPLLRKTKDERFLVVDDSFFNPIREMR